MDDVAIVARIEQDVWAFQRLLARTPSITVHDTPDLLWLSGPLASPLCNGVFRANLEPHRVDEVVKTVLARHAGLGSPLSWWVGPSMRPPDLVERLLHREFHLVADEPGMALDLARFEHTPTPVTGFDVVPVTDEATLHQWIAVAGTGDPVYAETCGAFSTPDCFVERGIMRLFLGRLDGEPVATSLLFTGSGVASVQNVITLPTARRRGFGAAMAATALVEGRERGLTLAVLTATPMAAGIYERIGFRRYCSFAVLQHDGSGATR